MTLLTTRVVRRMFGAVACCVAACWTLAFTWGPAPSVAAPATPSQLRTGFLDPLFLDSDAATRASWLQRASAVGASVIRIELCWSCVAPTATDPSFNPRDPADPRYRWARTDAAVRDAEARGLTVLLDINYAPTWAEGPGRPADAPAGTWRPNPAMLGEFAEAAARRYSGRFADPTASGAVATLPRVRYWQAWNEPNLSFYLTPQWENSPAGWTAQSPVIYRSLLNAVYRAVKRVQPDGQVLEAGTAPYGDPTPGADRMPPVTFLNALLCLDPSGRHATRCSDPAHFDILDHHPYGIGGPLWHAINPGDAAIPDMARLTGPLEVAERAGTALPRGRKPIWITEMSWESSPPDPEGVPEPMHAYWIEQAMWELWREGASVVLNYLIRDQPPIPSYAATFQSGVYFLDGSPKPADAIAFRFPFVTQRRGHSRVDLWGLAPRGRAIVVIERQVPGGWKRVASLRARSSRMFTGRIRQVGGAVLRASSGAEESLPWTQK